MDREIRSPHLTQSSKIVNEANHSPTAPHRGGSESERCLRPYLGGTVTLAAVIGAVLLLVALRTDNVLAHEESNRDDHACIEDSEHDATGPHMLYASSRHDHLTVTSISGISGITVKTIGNDFDYLGHDVSVSPDESVFMITYTVNSLPGVLEICWDDQLGLWFPIDMSDGSSNNNNGNTNTDTSTTTENIGTDTDTSTTTEDLGTDTSTTTENIGTDTDTDNNRDVISVGPIILPDLNTNPNPAPKSADSPTPTPTYKPKPTKTPTSSSNNNAHAVTNTCTVLNAVANGRRPRLRQRPPRYLRFPACRRETQPQHRRARARRRTSLRRHPHRYPPYLPTGIRLWSRPRHPHSRRGRLPGRHEYPFRP